jgi:hypothetical protein
MAIGPGKYDDLAALVREQSQAEGVIVMVIRGHRGSGFAVHVTPELTAALPAMLRRLADDLEADIVAKWTAVLGDHGRK